MISRRRYDRVFIILVVALLVALVLSSLPLGMDAAAILLVAAAVALTTADRPLPVPAQAVYRLSRARSPPPNR